MKVLLDALSESQREIVDVVGVDNYIKLTRRFGGNNIYIQKYSELARPTRDQEILQRFNGYNYAELAAEFDLSVRTIYKLVSHLIRQRKNAPLPDQVRWF